MAFKVCVESLSRQAATMGADAVIGLQMDFNVQRTAGVAHFVVQLFGTAVRRK